MPAVKITKRVVDAAEPRASRYTIFDSLVVGFGLWVFPSGQKSWVFEYRPYGSSKETRKKRLTIGGVADLSADEARKQAEGYRAIVRVGGDPQGTKQAERDAPTLEKVAKDFLDLHVAKKWGTSRLESYEDALKLHVLPKYGKRKAKDFTAEVDAFIEARTGRPRGSDDVLVHRIICRTSEAGPQVVPVPPAWIGAAPR